MRQLQEGLSQRQTQLLKVLVDEYIETAEPVGSVSIEKKYDIGVSPATIRNDMADLTNKGYLKQPHTSAGRIPTPLAMKFYINQLMEEKKLSVTDEVQAKEDVWDSRADIDNLLRDATQALAQKTNQLAIAILNDGNQYTYGHSMIFEHPEFLDYQVAQAIFSILEQDRRVREIFFKHITGATPIEILFGEELGWEFFEPVGVVATRFKVGNNEGALAVVGPVRLNYSNVIPMVRYFGRLIEEIGQAHHV